MAPYPPIREPSRPHPTVGGSSQVMSVGEVSLIQTLTVYEASLGDHEGACQTQGLPLVSLAKTQDGCIPGRFSKGSSNPRSALGESRFSKGSSYPRSALGESCFSKGLSNPRFTLGESRFSKSS
ncbi:hypothetical protein JHK82_039723 [Glycine max]|nr:hypothetical protein JHK86_039917 [Glycine max]KAG4965523.1 hypothetical protein JHK85_040498 [Glycine max]KAG5110500.1 hypothetical protein JHK82_039723 [Glycine max]KAG5121791.1 hypothetical protein JHK84_040131 [Glycine max]